MPQDVDPGAEGGADHPGLADERRQLLARLDDWLETPMLILGFAWLAIFVYESVWSGGPALNIASTVIWIVFIADFLVKIFLAPSKAAYLRSNWLTVIALVVPALRVFRIFRVFRILRATRAVRGLRLVRLVSSVNRGMHALGATMKRRGVGYVVLLTIAVTFAGAAGMYAFEHDAPSSAVTDYGDALWWTAMMMTTIGSDYFPQTPEARVLCFILAIFAFAVFGYVTATIATFFVGRDAANDDAEIAGAADIKKLQQAIAALHDELRELARRV